MYIDDTNISDLPFLPGEESYIYIDDANISDLPETYFDETEFPESEHFPGTCIY
jgi:hypothetical protein